MAPIVDCLKGQEGLSFRASLTRELQRKEDLMIGLNYLAIAVAAVTAVVLSTVYYTVFAKQMAALSAAAGDSARPPAWKILVELVRSLIVASVLAGFASKLGITDSTGGLLLGLSLWIGFPVVLLLGSVIWENVPPKLAALHAGDWLVKLLVVSVIVSIWH
jgi:hypothetical protein